MYPKDFTDYKFHPSDLAGLVDSFVKNHYSHPLTAKQQSEYQELTAKGSKSKKLNELQAKIDDKANKKHLELETSTKTTLWKIWSKESLAITKFVASKSTNIGNKYEQNSIDLVNQASGKTLTKNIITLSNDYLLGTPDIISIVDGICMIADIKTKTEFDIFHYSNQPEADQHFWQLWGYRQLVLDNQDKYPCQKIVTPIIFTLPSQSYDDILVRQQQLTRGITDLEPLETLNTQIYNNMNFDRVPVKARVKLFDVNSIELKDSTSLNYSQIDTGLVCKYLEQCRAYLNGITNNNLQYFNN